MRTIVECTKVDALIHRYTGHRREEMLNTTAEHEKTTELGRSLRKLKAKVKAAIRDEEEFPASRSSCLRCYEGSDNLKLLAGQH